MKQLIKTWDSLKFSDPKVFALVTIGGNVVLNALLWCAEYGSPEYKTMCSSAVSFLALVLSQMGVRTSRFIQRDQPENNEKTDE
jgi:hypothetical protein